jgi:transcriptional regulator with XRE-family HTH domain
MDAPLGHDDVKRERERRGWSIRDAAHHGGISNETWGRYEHSGRITPRIRQAVSEAFDWPLSWPDMASQADVDVVVTKLDSLARLVERLQDTLEQGLLSGIQVQEHLTSRVDRLERRGEAAGGEPSP